MIDDSCDTWSQSPLIGATALPSPLQNTRAVKSITFNIGSGMITLHALILSRLPKPIDYPQPEQ